MSADEALFPTQNSPSEIRYEETEEVEDTLGSALCSSVAFLATTLIVCISFPRAWARPVFLTVSLDPW